MEEAVHFWRQDAKASTRGPEGTGPVLLSPNARILAFGSGQITKLWDLNDRQEKQPSCRGMPVGFISNNELLIHVAGRLEQWDFDSNQTTASWTNSDRFEIIRDSDS